jgi:hypothetical protein
MKRFILLSNIKLKKMMKQLLFVLAIAWLSVAGFAQPVDSS